MNHFLASKCLVAISGGLLCTMLWSNTAFAEQIEQKPDLGIEGCSNPLQYTANIDALASCRETYDAGDAEQGVPGDPRVLMCFQLRAGRLALEDLRGYDPCEALNNQLTTVNADISNATEGAVELWASLAYAVLPTPGSDDVWHQGGPVFAMMSNMAWLDFVNVPRRDDASTSPLRPLFSELTPNTWQMVSFASDKTERWNDGDVARWRVIGNLLAQRHEGMDLKTTPQTLDLKLPMIVEGYYDPAAVSEINLAGIVIDRISF